MTDASTQSLPIVRQMFKPRRERAHAPAAAGSRGNHRTFFVSALRLADIGILALVSVVASLLIKGSYPTDRAAFAQIILIILFTQLFFQAAGLYRALPVRHPFSGQVMLVVTSLGVGATIVALRIFLGVFADFPQTGGVACFIAALVGFSAVRIFAHWRLQRLHTTGKMAVPIAVVGTQDARRRLQTRLSPYLGTDVDVVAFFDLDQARASPSNELFLLCGTGRIAEILVAVDGEDGQALNALLQQLGSLAITVRLVPDVPITTFACLSFKEVYGAPAISVIRHPLTETQIATKRFLDIALAATAIVLTAPITLLIAVLIKIDSPGPILFRQERWGINSRRIMVLKFRTMFTDKTPDPKVTQARRADPRISRVGRYLRRNSLDELPQLLNVLAGEMSLVGPRPHASAHNELYADRIENYLRRHRLKPGITGLAQVNGCRGATDTIDKMQRRVHYDLRYIDNWSLWLDLKIMLKTLVVGFRHPNAY